ncbi:MAG: DAK2 domain-containing protein [Geminicoccales bacterium]
MRKFTLAAASVLLLTTTSLAGAAKAEDLTLCWAAWDPANALVELSKDFTAKSGHDLSFEFVPWPNFADRMLNELNSGGQLCDLLIGDSQWIGGGAKAGDRTLIDALAPALESLSEGIWPAATAARLGADGTASIKRAKAGRATYVPESNLAGHNDPGAEAVAFLFAGLATHLEET